jgi:hypothetical protein
MTEIASRVQAGLINLFQSSGLSHKYITKPKGENDERCIKNRSGFRPIRDEEDYGREWRRMWCWLCNRMP